MNIDILAFGAHPDDVECAASGIVLNTTANHGKVVIVDLTRGELGSFGDEHSRKEELLKASKMMNLFGREQLDLEDGNIDNIRKSAESDSSYSKIPAQNCFGKCHSRPSSRS